MMKKLISLLLFIVIYSSTFSQTTKVLFIGNSLTGWHDQPMMFGEIASEAGFDVSSVNSLWFGTDIAQHLSWPTTLDNIASEDWDYIVLQGNKYEIAFPEHHDILYPTFESFEALIHEHYANTKIIFFMDWAYPNGINWGGITYTCNDFQELIKSGTMLFADSMNFIVSPIGQAFNYVINDNPDINLIDSDNIHPSLHGSYLAACVYFYLIFGEDFNGQITYYNEIQIDEANYLKDVAKDIVMSNYDYWYSTYTDNTGTNINNFQGKNNLFEIFPNPANNKIYIDFNNTSGNYELYIYDSFGRKVKHVKNVHIPQEVDISMLSEGIYITEIVMNNHRITKKFMINR
jgi:Secretion system C-terminal sorting domain/Domain of unknown function (DUF4886)